MCTIRVPCLLFKSSINYYIPYLRGAGLRLVLMTTVMALRLKRLMPPRETTMWQCVGTQTTKPYLEPL